MRGAETIQGKSMLGRKRKYKAPALKGSEDIKGSMRRLMWWPKVSKEKRTGSGREVTRSGRMGQAMGSNGGVTLILMGKQWGSEQRKNVIEFIPCGTM